MHHCLFKVKIESDPEFLGATISHCHSLPALWQIVLSILKRVMFDQKKRIFSLIFFFRVSERYDQWRQTKQIFFTTFVFNFVCFFSSIFFFCRSRVYFFWCTVFLCNCYQNVCQTQPWFINLIIILPRERKTLMLITWLNEILECPFTDKCIFLL